VKDLLRIILVFVFIGLGLFLGWFLWALMEHHLLDDITQALGRRPSLGEGILSLFLTSSISAVFCGFIGYRISRSIK